MIHPITLFKNKKNIFYVVFLVFIVILLILLSLGFRKLFHFAMLDSSDLAVFWRSANALFEGKDPYSQLGDNPGFVFKYHPSILVLFFPFAWISLKTCQTIWFFLEVFSIIYCLYWLRRSGVSTRILIFSTGLFWFLWFEHFRYGQIMLPILAFCLHTMTPSRNRSSWKLALMLEALSIKIFTLLCLPGIWKKIFTRKALIGFCILLGVSHLLLIAVFFYQHLNPISEIVTLYENWVRNIFFNVQGLGLGNVRGSTNHGFPALLLRQIDPTGIHPEWDTPASLLVGGILGTLWWIYSKNLRFEKQWSGWLALTAVAHPLAWSHSFVFVFPLATYAIHSAIHSYPRENYRRRTMLLALSVLGVLMMGWWVPQTVGLDRAIVLELWGIKSWGALLCALSLLIA